LSYATTEEELKKEFEKYGVKEAIVVKNNFNGRYDFLNLQNNTQCSSRGYGFVEFNAPEGQKSALNEKGSSFNFGGRSVFVHPAYERPVVTEGTKN
jgi:RNA recognition motif-containing protein